MNSIYCLLFLAGSLFLGGVDSFHFGARHAHNNNRAVPTFVTRLNYPSELKNRHFSPSTHQSSSSSSKLYSSLPNDVADSVALEEEVPPNIAWLNERFNFTKVQEGKLRNNIESSIPGLLTLGQPVLICRANWLQKRLKLNDEELGSILRRDPNILSCRPDTNLEPTLDYLQERLALNTKTLSKVVQKHSSILGNSITESLEPKLTWLQKRLHLNETKALQKYVAKSPEILSLSTEDNLGPKFEWLQERLNLTELETAKLCAKAPKILTCSVDVNLEPTLKFLQERLELDQTQLGKVIGRAPVILLFCVRNLENTLQWLQQQLCLDDASLRKIVVRIPNIMGLSPSTNLEPTAQWLQEHFLLDQDEDVGKLVLKFPPLLSMSIATNLEPTLDFFKECIGDEAAVGLVLMNPRVLGASLENRLKPRLEEAQQIGIEIDAGCLQRMAQMTVERWHKSLDYQSKGLAKSKAEESLW